MNIAIFTCLQGCGRFEAYWGDTGPHLRAAECPTCGKAGLANSDTGCVHPEGTMKVQEEQELWKEERTN